jgi:hypothetical protein
VGVAAQVAQQGGGWVVTGLGEECGCVGEAAQRFGGGARGWP